MPYEIGLNMLVSAFVRLCNVCDKNSPNSRNEDINFEVAENIGNSCLQVGIKNAPNQSKDMRATQYTLRACKFLKARDFPVTCAKW